MKFLDVFKDLFLAKSTEESKNEVEEARTRRDLDIIRQERELEEDVKFLELQAKVLGRR